MTTRRSEGTAFQGRKKEMMNFGDGGIICLNRDIRGECQNCLWWEWDSQKGECRNGRSPCCAIYRRRLLFSETDSEPLPGFLSGRGL